MADDDDKKTEEVPDTPPPNPDPDPPAVEPRSDDDLRSTVNTLAETVQGVVQRLDQLTPTAPLDTTPTKVPWTHKGFR